jgi:tetratricopeptide (TPR) repeat protein
MKRFLLLGAIIAVLGGGVFAYFQYGGSPEVKRDRYLQRAREYLKESKLGDAIVEFQNAVKADPRSAEARVELAKALVKRGDLRGAYRELVRAVDLKPDFVKARYELASLELLRNNLSGAKDHLEKIRAVDRNAFETRYLAVKIAMAEKKPDRAIAELEEIAKNDVTTAFAFTEIGIIQFAAKKFPAAEAAFLKALKANPKHSDARVGLAQVYVSLGDQDKAEEQLIRATQDDPENDNLLHVLGLFYTGARKIDQFEKLYLDLLKKKPSSLVARKRLAEVYIATARFKNAQPYVDDILKMNPEDPDGHFFRGRLRLANNELVTAAEDFTVAVKGAPRLAPAFYYLGVTQTSLKRVDDAKKNLTKAIELNPAWVPPRVFAAQLFAVTGDMDQALEQSDVILRAQPKNVSMLMVAASARLRKGDTNGALALFKRAKELNPKNSAVHMNLGATYTAMRKYNDAIKEFDEALQLNPERLEALASIVRLYILQDNFKTAFERASQYLSKTKNQADVYQLMGQTKHAAKEFQPGIEYLEKAINLNPNAMTAYYQIGNAYAAQKKFDIAISQYEKVIAKSPKAIPPLMMAAILYDRKAQSDKANEYYRKILDVNKNFVPAANNLAWNYANFGGNLDVALGLAQRARELAPQDPGVADTLGWLTYKKGLYPSAISLLKESNEGFKGNNPAVLYHLGMAYLKSGDKSLAAETLGKALSSEKNFAGIDEAKKTLEEIKPRPK